jgi:hypothetical protein
MFLVVGYNNTRLHALLSNRLYHLSAHTDHAMHYHEVIGYNSGLIVKSTKINGEYELDVPNLLSWRVVL